MPEAWAESLDEVTIEQMRAALFVLLGLGTVYCVLGYRLFKLILGLTGFALAGGTAALLVAWLTDGHLAGMAIAGCIGGVCGAMALYFLYHVGVFCIGALGGIAAAYSLLGGSAEPWAPAVMLALALLAGLVALLIERPVMMLATAAIGAMLVVYSGAFLAFGEAFIATLETPDEAGWEPWAIAGAWAAATLFGAAVQWSTRKRAA